MATFASLNIGMSANSAKLSKDLTKARKRTKRFGKGAKKDFRGISKAFSGLKGLLAGGLAISGIKTLLDDLDNIAKSALSTGLSAKNYQLLTAALEELGVPAGVAKKSIIKLQQALGEAQKGTKTYTDALGAIGLEYDDLKKLSPVDQVLKVIEALGRIEDPAIRAQAGMLLLGRGYSVMGAAFEAGEKGIDAIMKKFERLGIVVGPEQLQSAQDLNDAMLALGKQFKAVLADLLLPLIKKLIPLLRDFANWASENKALVTMTAQFLAFGAALKAFSFILSPFAGITKSLIKGIGKMATAVALRLAPLGASILSGPVGWIALGAVVIGGAAYAFWPQISKFFTDMWNDLTAWFKGIEWSSVWKYLTPVGLALTLWDNIKGPLNSMWTNIKNWFSSLDFGSLWDGFTDSLPDFFGDSKDIKTDRRGRRLNRVGNISKTAKGSMRASAKDNDIIQTTKNSFREAFERVFGGNTFTEFATTLKTNLSSALQTGDFKGALKNIFQTLANNLSNIAAQQMTDAIIGNSISGSGGFLASLFGFSRGGVVPGNGNPLVDSVPIMAAPGEVVLNPARGQGMGGDTYNITVSAIDTQSFNDRLARDPKLVSQIAEVGKRSTQGIRR